jgi:superfamily II DNA/RNA helicase
MGPFARSRLYCTLLQRAKPAEIVVDARKDSAGSFSELRLSRKLLETMAHRGITKPTEAQSAAMLEIQSGRDVMLSAETGSGKTLSYLLTLLNHSIEHPREAGGGLRKLVLVPTNVLAHQLCGIQRDLAFRGEPGRSCGVCAGQVYRTSYSLAAACSRLVRQR